LLARFHWCSDSAGPPVRKKNAREPGTRSGAQVGSMTFRSVHADAMP